MAEVVRPFAVDLIPHEIEGPRPLVRKVDEPEPFPVQALGGLSSAAEDTEAAA